MPYPDSDRGVNRPGILIMDTGPIWELILYRAVKELGFAGLKRNLTYFVDSEAYETCGNFLSSFRKKTTSASVVAQLHTFIRGTDRQGRRQLWAQVYDEFEKMGMDEDVVRLLDMDPDLIAKYGPTDVSLLEIARRNLKQRPVILTLDSPLHSECRKAGIQSELLIEVCNPVNDWT